MLRLKLKTFLRGRGISETALANAIADVLTGADRGVSDRHLRYLTQNTAPLTKESPLRKPSLITLGLIIRGLRKLTGEEVDVNDILEYVPTGSERSPSGPTERLPQPPPTKPPPVPSPSAEGAGNALARLDHDEAADVLDEVWELVVHRLEARGYGDLAAALRATEEQPPAGDADSRPAGGPRTSKPFPRRIHFVSVLVLLLVASGYIAYDHYVLKPQLLTRYAQLFSFRDRVRPTSKLPVPTLIGPEGEITQLTPVLRVSNVPGALAYEFFVKNLVSDDGVYSGPVPNNSFPVPDNTLCPHTPYEWRARALGDDGWGSFTSPVTFVVSAEALGPEHAYLTRLADISAKPKTPEVVAPMGSASSTTPTLELSYDPDVMGYGFYVRDLQSDRIIYANNFATSHSVTLPPELLEDGGVYQWNARSRNCHYWSDFTLPKIFTVNVHE